MNRQLVMGLITGANSALPAALAVPSPLAIYSYDSAETREQEKRKANTERESLGRRTWDNTKDEGRDYVAGLPGDFVASSAAINQAASREAREFAQQAAAREAAGDFAGAANSRIAQGAASRVYSTPWKGMLKGMGIGLAGGIVNFVLDQISNSYEDGMHREAGITADRADRILDKNSHIGIIATEA